MNIRQCGWAPFEFRQSLFLDISATGCVVPFAFTVPWISEKILTLVSTIYQNELLAFIVMVQERCEGCVLASNCASANILCPHHSSSARKFLAERCSHHGSQAHPLIDFRYFSFMHLYAPGASLPGVYLHLIGPCPSF